MLAKTKYRSKNIEEELLHAKAYTDLVQLTLHPPFLRGEIAKDIIQGSPDILFNEKSKSVQMTSTSIDLLLTVIHLLVNSFISLNVLSEEEIQKIVKLAQKYYANLSKQDDKISFNFVFRQKKDKFILEYKDENSSLVNLKLFLRLEIPRSRPNQHLLESYLPNNPHLANVLNNILAASKIRSQLELEPLAREKLLLKEHGEIVSSEHNFKVIYEFVQKLDPSNGFKQLNLELEIVSFYGQRIGKISIGIIGNLDESIIQKLASIAPKNPRVYL
jgi:hypothetical protein